MQKTAHYTLTRAILRLLRPLVRILLRNGIAYGSFAELVKKTYVDVAFEDFAPRGKKQTVSRVSAMTGLTRKETKRLYVMKDPDAGNTQQRYNRAVRVISGWLNDPAFHTADGRPAQLAVDQGATSFAALVKKYGGDVTTQSMLAVLESAASVQRTERGIELVQRAYLPGNDSGETLHILGADTAELIGTIDYNLGAEENDRRFQRKVSSYHLRADAVADFRVLAATRSQALLEELDAWLSTHEIEAGRPLESARYVSLGIYFFERPPAVRGHAQRDSGSRPEQQD
jgi:hypothetical protein